jgi:hypothetical protein
MHNAQPFYYIYDSTQDGKSKLKINKYTWIQLHLFILDDSTT